MQEFVLKELVTQDLELELEKIGFDIAYRAKASDKFRYKTFKIFDLTLPQANILKQTALSLGADCAVHRDILTAKVEKTDVLLGGSFSQLKKIAEKLKLQPFSMKILAENIINLLDEKKRQTKLVGILNITPDSFSDGGLYFNCDDAIRQMYKLIEDGADIIDIGAESTRPYSIPVESSEQIDRLKPLLKNISDIEIPISVDTRNAEVADFVLNNGAQIINDVSGLNSDPKMLDVISRYNAKIIIQHSTSRAENIVQYEDVVESVYNFFLSKINLAKEKGVVDIIIDPGIGFGKTKENCFEILDRIKEFYSLNLPIMLGVSRKTFLGVSDSNNDLKDAFTLAISYPLMKNKVDYLRVHNVKIHRQLLDSVI